MKGETLVKYDEKTMHAIESIVTASESIGYAEPILNGGNTPLLSRIDDREAPELKTDKVIITIFKGWIYGKLRELKSEGRPELVEDYYKSQRT